MYVITPRRIIPSPLAGAVQCLRRKHCAHCSDKQSLSSLKSPLAGAAQCLRRSRQQYCCLEDDLLIIPNEFIAAVPVPTRSLIICAASILVLCCFKPSLCQLPVPYGLMLKLINKVALF